MIDIITQLKNLKKELTLWVASGNGFDMFPLTKKEQARILKRKERELKRLKDVRKT